MLNRNEFKFLYEKEKDFNVFIKLLTMIKIRKLPIICLIYFISIQASNISSCREETNIKDVLIEIKEENRIEKQDNGIIGDLGYKANLNADNTEFTINSLEYHGIGIANTNRNNYYGFSDLKLNDEGKLEGKDKSNNDVLENEMMITHIMFYANITINNKIVNTFIYVILTENIAYNNIYNDIYKVKLYYFCICLDNDSNGVYYSKDYDYMVGLNILECLGNFKLFILDNKIISIKISNFKNAGYIYYLNSKSEKIMRITLKPEIPFDKKGEKTTNQKITSDEKGEEVTINQETTSKKDIKEKTKPETLFDGKGKEIISKNNIKIGNTTIALISVQIIFWLFIQIY